jgi:PleD family two-component response regulator
MKQFNRLFAVKEDSLADICNEKTFHRQLKIERSRAHRNGHVFSLVVFDLKEIRFKKKYADRMMNTVLTRMADYDRMGWYDKNKLGVILPYASAKEANVFSKNIIYSFTNARKETRYTIITYPPENKLPKQSITGPILRSI